MSGIERGKYQVRNEELVQGQIYTEQSVIHQHFYPPDAPLHQPPQSAMTVPASPFLFLCFAPKDLPLAERLRDGLHAQGMTGWVGHKTFQLGSAHEQEHLREVIRRALAVILVASPHTRRSRLVRQELYIAEMYQRPVYLFWMQGNQLVEVMPASRSGLPFFDARGEYHAQTLQNLLQAISKQVSPSSSQDLFSEQLTPPPEAPRNPYKGLQAFRTEDAQDFFGRDDLIKTLLEKVQQLLTIDQQDKAASRLLTVLGPSGSGKSSVVMAGLIPQLKQGALSGSQNWIYLDPMVPGKHPIEALALTLALLFPERSPLKIMHEDLEDDSARGLHLLLATYVKRPGVSVLLVIDQFEELFTQTATEDERRQFLELVLTAITEPDGPLMVVVTLRADFYDQPLRYPELGQIIENHHVTAYSLETRNLRAVIEQPAQLSDVQLTFEEDLIGDLLFDVQGQVGTLPLLQFTLDQLFQHRQERLLTRQAYHQIGGVKGALAQHAERTYESLPTPTHQRLARALFLRLINLGTVEQDATKRRVPFSELVFIDPEETARLTEVRNDFTRARLLTASTVGGAPTIEVSHEALIRAWTRLEDWLHEARDDIRLQQAISENAAEWLRHRQPADRLYRGSQLTEALKWREANIPSIDEDRFLRASIKEQHRSQRRIVLIGLVSGVVGITGTNFLVMMLRGGEAKSLPQPFRLPYTYPGHAGPVNSVAWSSDGKRIASGSNDKTVQVWDASTGNPLLTYKGHTGPVNSVAWSSDGKRIASGSADKTVQVWDASNSNLLCTYKGHLDSVKSVAWSPDGKRIASGSDDSTVQVWDATSGSHLLTYRGHRDPVKSVTWSPDGKHIASGSEDKTVQVWDASNGHLLFPYRRHHDAINSVAWSPDGKHIASGSFDETVQVWEASSGYLLLTYQVPVNSVAWSPDGKCIAFACNDDTAQVWDASNSRLLLPYWKHTDKVNSVAWSPDGKRIVSGSNDDTAQVWEASSGNSPLLTYQGTSSVKSVAWSPDDKYIASGSGDNTVQVWEASSGRLLLTYRGHTDVVNSVAWSPDGKRIASGSDDDTVQVWDASTGSQLFTYQGHTDAVNSVAWSPDGKRIASGFDDDTVQVWDASTGSQLFTYKGHTDVVNSVAWSPDGKRIASGSDDNTVQVWDASNDHLLHTYQVLVNSVAWSPDGKRIASGSADKMVQVWDTSNGSQLLTYRGHDADVYNVAWSPDGKHIASGSGDKTVQVWDVTSGSLLRIYKGHTDKVNSVAWSSDGKRIASGSSDGMVQVWDASRLK